MAVVKQHGHVCSAEVAEQLGADQRVIGKDLCTLVDRGLIARVRWGLYSADDDGKLRRQALLNELQKLSV